MKKSHKHIKRHHKSKRHHKIKRHHSKRQHSKRNSKTKYNSKTKRHHNTKRHHRRGRTAGGPKTYNKKDKIMQLMTRDPTLDYETAAAAAEHFAPKYHLPVAAWHAATQKHLDRRNKAADERIAREKETAKSRRRWQQEQVAEIERRAAAAAEERRAAAEVDKQAQAAIEEYNTSHKLPPREQFNYTAPQDHPPPPIRFKLWWGKNTPTESEFHPDVKTGAE